MGLLVVYRCYARSISAVELGNGDFQYFSPRRDISSKFPWARNAERGTRRRLAGKGFIDGCTKLKIDSGARVATPVNKL